jgi:putative transposase
MKRKRFSEERIIAVLREHDAGAKAADLARKYGVSEATLYNWKAKYGGLDEGRGFIDQYVQPAPPCRA